MLDAGDDVERRRRLGKVPRPRLVERRIVVAVGEIDLGVHHVLQPGAGQRQRLHHALRDDELGLELDRLAGPLRALGHQRRGGDAVAPRLVADRERRDAGNEDEVADRERRRIAGGRAAGERLVLEMRHLEALLRNDAERLDVHVGAGQQQALLGDRGRRRNAPAQELAPDLLVGRHRLHRRVVLVGADEIGAVGAGGAQHRVDVLEDAQRLLLALGQAGMRRALRQHVRRDAVLEVLRHHAGGEHPAAGLHALRELDLARRRARRGAAALHPLSVISTRHPDRWNPSAWHCGWQAAIRARGLDPVDTWRAADVRSAQASGMHSCGRTTGASPFDQERHMTISLRLGCG